MQKLNVASVKQPAALIGSIICPNMMYNGQEITVNSRKEQFSTSKKKTHKHTTCWCVYVPLPLK